MLDTATLEAVERFLVVRKAQQQDELSQTIIGSLLSEITDRRKTIENAKTNTDSLQVVKQTKQCKIYRCPLCENTRSVYKIHFSLAHVRILQKIFVHCVENKTHIIKKSDIVTLTHWDYTNFPVLQRFGFLYWLQDEEGNRTRKWGKWGVAVKRIRDFLIWAYEVAEYSERDTATKKQRTSDRRITIAEVRRYSDEQRKKDNESFLPYFITYEENETI